MNATVNELIFEAYVIARLGANVCDASDIGTRAAEYAIYSVAGTGRSSHWRGQAASVNLGRLRRALARRP